MALSEGLLEAALNYLDITWEDDAGRAKISGILERGIQYHNRVAGAELDYMVEDKPRELLFNYCRYDRDSALADYVNDYLPEIMALQLDSMVKQHEP